MANDNRARFPEPENGMQLITEFIRSGAWGQCTNTEKTVYIALADRCGDCMLRTWISYKTIAEDTGLSKRSAIAAIASLQEKGFVAVKPRYTDKGIQTSNFFEMIIPFPEGPALTHKPRGRGVKSNTPITNRNSVPESGKGCQIKHPPSVKLDTGGGDKSGNSGVSDLAPKEIKAQETNSFKRPGKGCSLSGAPPPLTALDRCLRQEFERFITDWKKEPAGKFHAGYRRGYSEIESPEATAWKTWVRYLKCADDVWDLIDILYRHDLKDYKKEYFGHSDMPAGVIAMAARRCIGEKLKSAGFKSPNGRYINSIVGDIDRISLDKFPGLNALVELIKSSCPDQVLDRSKLPLFLRTQKEQRELTEQGGAK
jgi:hypothetical protein